MALSDSDAKLLELWGQSWTYPAVRDNRVTEATGLTPTRAAQRLNRLIDTREALEHDPVTVNRLRRMRDSRKVRRVA